MSNSNKASGLPDSVPTGGARAWRPSDGKIVRGREGDMENRDAILGYLREIHVFYGDTPEGQGYGKLEAVLETNRGREVFGTNIMNASSGKPTLSSSVTFALGLLDCAKDELIQVSVRCGKEKNRFGTFSTYVNIHGLDPVTTAVRGRKGPERSPDAPQWTEDYLDELLPQIAGHPAYTERSGAIDPGTGKTPQITGEDEFDPFADE